MSTTTQTHIPTVTTGQIPVAHAVGKEMGSFAFGEIGGDIVWVLGALLVDHIPKGPMNYASEALGKIIEPYLLDPAEKLMSAICKLDECQPDKNKSRPKRAKDMAELIIKYAPIFAISLKAKFLIRRICNKNVFHLPEEIRRAAPTSFLGKMADKATLGFMRNSREENMLILADEIPMIGSAWYFGNCDAKHTDKRIKDTADFYHKLGLNEKQSKELAVGTWGYMIPNGIGALGYALGVTGKQAFGLPNEFRYRTHVDITQPHSV